MKGTPRTARSRRNGARGNDEVLRRAAEKAERLVLIDLGRALSLTEQAVEAADSRATGTVRSRVRQARATALAYLNRYEEALATLTEAADLDQAAGNRVGVARSWMAMMHPLGRLGRVREAVDRGEAAREVFLAEGRAMLTARAEINLGVVRRAGDDPVAALAHFDLARPAVVNEPQILAQLDSNRAMALLDLNRFSEAEAAFRSALDAFRSTGRRRAAAIVEGNLADLMSRQGRLQSALFHVERARRDLEADDAVGDLARLQSEQAETFAALGLLDEAVETYNAALPQLESAGLTHEAARGYVGLGHVLARMGRYAEAEATLSGAVELAILRTDELGRALRTLGEVAIVRKQPEQAAWMLRVAVALLQQRPADAALARLHLASVALERGEILKAMRLIRLSLRTARRLHLEPLRADLLHLRSKVRRRLGRRAQALADLRAAVSAVEKIRGSLQAGRFRTAFVGDRTAVYQDLVAALVEEPTPESTAAAFHAVEQAKARSLLDVVSGALDRDVVSDAEDEDPVTRALAERVRRLRRDLNALYSQVSNRGPAGSRGTEPWRCRVAQGGAELGLLESRLASTRGAGGLFAPPIGLETARRLIDPSTAMIQYFTAGDDVLAIVVRSDRQRVHRHLVRSRRLQWHVERLRFEMLRPLSYAGHADQRGLVDDARRELAELHAMLVEPLAESLAGASRLLVAPHGLLHAVPFHALYDGRQYLIERFEVTYAPSASLLRLVTHAADGGEAQAGRRGLVLGFGDAAARLVEDEARAVAGALGDASLHVGPQATSGRLAEEGRGAYVVHLACHARFVSQSPLASGLRLADGWLTIPDLYGIRLDGCAVVLSGCDTGRTAVGGADELVGLVSGFLSAGAAAVMMSLWALNDESARDLLARAYQRWDKRPAGLAAALRTAQLEAMRRRPHPLFWAPFVVVGRT